MVFHKVLVEVSHKPPLKQETKVPVIYKEQSSGEFEILAKDEKIRTYFKEIQAAIKENLLRELRESKNEI